MSEPSRPRVSAALANWNGVRYLERCLGALRAQSHELEQIIVVDNGSTDGSVEWLAGQEDVTLIRSQTNRGYCWGYNRAIEAAETPFVLTLNTDAYLDELFVASCLREIGEDARCAAVTGTFFEEATGQRIGGGFWLRRQIRMVSTPATGQSTQVFGVTGAAALFRLAALKDVQVEGQVYDEAYFSYGEDIDLAWRLWLLGWQCRFTPLANAHHVGSGSLQGALRFLDKPAFFQRQVLRNRYLTLLKNARAGDMFDLLPSMGLGELALWPYLLLRQPWRFPALLKTPLELCQRLPRAWRWRREIQKRRDATIGSLRPWLKGW